MQKSGGSSVSGASLRKNVRGVSSSGNVLLYRSASSSHVRFRPPLCMCPRIESLILRTSAMSSKRLMDLMAISLSCGAVLDISDAPSSPAAKDDVVSVTSVPADVSTRAEACARTTRFFETTNQKFWPIRNSLPGEIKKVIPLSRSSEMCLFSMPLGVINRSLSSREFIPLNRGKIKKKPAPRAGPRVREVPMGCLFAG